MVCHKIFSHYIELHHFCLPSSKWNINRQVKWWKDSRWEDVMIRDRGRKTDRDEWDNLRWMDECSDGQRGSDKETVKFPSYPLPLIPPCPTPSLHPSSACSSPTGPNICLLPEWDTSFGGKKEKQKNPFQCDIRSDSSPNTNQLDVTSSVFTWQPASAPPPRSWRSVGLTVGAAEICHFSWGLELNVPAKPLQNRCWHKSGRFRKLTWPRGFGGWMPEECRK